MFFFKVLQKRDGNAVLSLINFNSRTYIAKSLSGVCYRRNRVHLRIDKSNDFANNDLDITHPIFCNVNIDNNFDTNLATAQNRQPRERRAPRWFDDYVM